MDKYLDTLFFIGQKNSILAYLKVPFKGLKSAVIYWLTITAKRQNWLKCQDFGREVAILISIVTWMIVEWIFLE